VAPTRASERSRLEECSSEPIRTPGSIQPHGALLAFDRESRRVIVVSENAEDFLGIPPEAILGQTAEQLMGDAAIPGLVLAAEGANPRDLEIMGRKYDAIVHRDGPISFVELEPQLPDFNERDAAAATYGAADRLAKLTDRAQLVKHITVEFSALTGFDRVMLYHFHPDKHGEVVSEVHADRMEPYLGLHFPASDIPVQARALYLTKTSRAIVSTVTPPVPLLASSENEALEIDLTHAELRAVSPFHLQFMRNMGQASTLSFSLIYRGELIGMITCAHNTERQVTFLMRRNLEVLANQVALQLGAAADIQRLTLRSRSQDLRMSLLGKIVASDDIAGALLDGDFTVTDVIAADAAAVRLNGEISHTANSPSVEQLDALLGDIGLGIHTNSLSVDHPELARAFPDFTGLLAVRLGDNGDFLAFFRREVVQTIDWLGDLTEQNRAQTLSPRLSFSAWRQSVTGMSLPWDDAVTAASVIAGDVASALLRREESRLATLAMLDPLTGLQNRRALTEHLARREGRPGEVSLLFIDLDNFKAVNDTHGHEAGDDVIIETARRLVAITRSDDRVVRLGGDEFVVMCENSSRAEAEALATRIADAARRPIGDAGHVVTASVGIVTMSANAATTEMLEQADAAMYRAKQAGRDRISF
jgi:two-component system, chemotaxis family, sensor kinase Cph1